MIKRPLIKSTYFSLFFLLLFCFFSQNVLAKTDPTVTASPSAIIAQKNAEAAQYELPYPGLLPGNPLYTLKVLRDHVVGFMVSGALKKAQFNLLQADKRLNAGVLLARDKKYALAEETISKAENYFEEAIRELHQAKQQGMDIAHQSRTMVIAAKKHEMVVADLLRSMPDSEAAKMKDTLGRIHEFEKDVEKLSPGKK